LGVRKTQDQGDFPELHLNELEILGSHAEKMLLDRIELFQFRILDQIGRDSLFDFDGVLDDRRTEDFDDRPIQYLVKISLRISQFPVSLLKEFPSSLIRSGATGRADGIEHIGNDVIAGKRGRIEKRRPPPNDRFERPRWNIKIKSRTAASLRSKAARIGATGAASFVPGRRPSLFSAGVGGTPAPAFLPRPEKK
jgi:hypothetical protein